MAIDGNPVRVLVVDDEKNIAHTLVQILSNEGYDAVCAGSGEEALGVLAHFQPDVMIADVVMDGMDGVQLALVAADILPACSILLFSGQADTSEVAARLEEAGRQFRIFAKPVPPRALLDLVEAEVVRLRQPPRPESTAPRPGSTGVAPQTAD